jgi:hypothetical protein
MKQRSIESTPILETPELLLALLVISALVITGCGDSYTQMKSFTLKEVVANRIEEKKVTGIFFFTLESAIEASHELSTNNQVFLPKIGTVVSTETCDSISKITTVHFFSINRCITSGVRDGLYFVELSE